MFWPMARYLATALVILLLGGGGALGHKPSGRVRHPSWVYQIVKPGQTLTPRELMDRAIRLSRANVEHGGGPFGAVLATPRGRVRGIGYNRVVSLSDPTAHGEVTAIRDATRRARSFRIPNLVLYTSAETCVMCAGSAFWAGVRKVVSGARKADVEAIGFVEGPTGFSSAEFFGDRGIEYEQDVLRDQAVDVLRTYADQNRIIYNGK